jgi:hypothetical protein
MPSVAALAVGLIILGLVLQDAFEVMLLPRRVQRRVRMVRVYFRVSWDFWRRAARVWPPSAPRERFLSVFGPLSMMILFILWAGLLIFAFGLVQWAVQPLTGPRTSLGGQTYMSGVTFFTLGFGDVVPRNSAGRTIAVLEAGTGFGLMAVVIGYLPVLY